MPIPIGYAEVTGRITVLGDSEEMNVVFGIETPATGFEQGDATNVSTALGTFLKGVMAPQATYQGVVIAVGAPGGDIFFESTVSSGPGTQGANASPQNVASLFRKSTALGGRRNRGRMFVPAVPETLVDQAGNITAATITDWNTKAATFLTNLGLGNTPMVILHPARPAPEPKPVPAAIPEINPTLVSTLALQPLVATQRRRLR